MNDLKFAIIGAGNGGLTMAADLIKRGFAVTGLYDRYASMIDPVRGKGGIELIDGEETTFAPVSNATTSMAEAVRDANVLMVVVPAFAHEYLAKEIAACIREDQLIILNPGYFGGCLVFDIELQAAGRKGYQIAETLILLYAARLVAPATVSILRTKSMLHLASLPGSAAQAIVERLRPAFPQLMPLKNILETGLNNTNPIGHVPTTLLNLGPVERQEEKNHFDFDQWVTPSIQRLSDAVEAERIAVVNALGIWCITKHEWHDLVYGERKRSIRAVTGPIPESAKTMPPRYIDEDVPMGLVPLTEIADLVGVEVPNAKALVTIASTVRGVDFAKCGRTLESLGIKGLSPRDLIKRLSR